MLFLFLLACSFITGNDQSVDCPEPLHTEVALGREWRTVNICLDEGVDHGEGHEDLSSLTIGMTAGIESLDHLGRVELTSSSPCVTMAFREGMAVLAFTGNPYDRLDLLVDGRSYTLASIFDAEGNFVAMGFLP